MEKKYLVAHQKLIQAVTSLATGPEDVRLRLPRVYPILADLSAHDFPETLREDFEWIIEKLTARMPRYCGPVVWETTAEASIAGMRKKTAVKVAQRIVYLSEKLRTLVCSG